MTKVIKWWHKISVWNKLRGSLTGVGALIQAEMIREGAHPNWNFLALIITAVTILLTNWIEDKNNNGKVDLFEKDNEEK